jgi:crotonobetainyl-CoA:carnitine CoA-transferase CaiB-like acyl-CoA transferase
MATAKPLAGITVVEIGHSIAAPFAGLILSELGADVLKVENPKGGDHARGWGPPFWEDTAAAYHAFNRGKKGLAIDFADPVAAGELRRLVVERADVVIQNLRAGVIDGYGLGPDSLLAERPDLIYCNLAAFGDSGPLAAKPGYDPLVQAFAGLMSITGEGGGRPPVRVGVSLNDMGAGMWSVIAILATLNERTRTGLGGRVSTSLYETALSWLTLPMASYQASGEVRRPHGSGVPEIVPYQCFATRDGWLMIAAGNDTLYRKLCTVLRHPEWSSDPRFQENAGRVANRDVLIPMLEAVIRDEPLTELAGRLDALGIPNAPLQDIAQVASHPQTQALGMMQAEREGGLPLLGLPISFDGERPALKWPAPKLGEHNSTLQNEGN